MAGLTEGQRATGTGPRCLAYTAEENSTQNGTVHSGKELDNITLEHIRITTRQSLTALQGCMGAFSNLAGIAIRDEARFKNGFELLHQGVVHHPIPERRSTLSVRAYSKPATPSDLRLRRAALRQVS